MYQSGCACRRCAACRDVHDRGGRQGVGARGGPCTPGRVPAIRCDRAVLVIAGPVVQGAAAGSGPIRPRRCLAPAKVWRAPFPPLRKLRRRSFPPVVGFCIRRIARIANHTSRRALVRRASYRNCQTGTTRHARPGTSRWA